jgi:hypothetical protein
MFNSELPFKQKDLDPCKDLRIRIAQKPTDPDTTPEHR